jgi:hypothetical protein
VLKEFKTKSKAEEAAEQFRLRISNTADRTEVTMEQVADRYKRERMPQRHSTYRGYSRKLKMILATWGKHSLPLNSDEVEFWLKELKNTKGVLYSKKSRKHLKSTLLILHDAAMFFRYLPIGANPMTLVKVPAVKAAPKEKPRIACVSGAWRSSAQRCTSYTNDILPEW